MRARGKGGGVEFKFISTKGPYISVWPSLVPLSRPLRWVNDEVFCGLHGRAIGKWNITIGWVKGIRGRF